MAENKHVVVYGSGCKSCKKLMENAQTAIENIGIDATSEYVTDMARIAQAGVMLTPALEVDGKVVSSGKLLKAKEIEKLLS